MTDKETCSAGHERCPGVMCDILDVAYGCTVCKRTQPTPDDIPHATCGTPTGEECREAPGPGVPAVVEISGGTYEETQTFSAGTALNPACWKIPRSQPAFVMDSQIEDFTCPDCPKLKGKK